MNDPYSPPVSYVSDQATPSRAGWGRVVLAVLIAAFLALFLGWFVVPLLISILGFAFGLFRFPDTAALILDLVFSGAAVALACKLATWIAPGRPYLVSLAIAAICCLVFFVMVGGPAGMLKQSYPMWYELFPVDWIAAGVVAFVTARRGAAGSSVAAVDSAP